MKDFLKTSKTTLIVNNCIHCIAIRKFYWVVSIAFKWKYSREPHLKRGITLNDEYFFVLSTVVVCVTKVDHHRFLS